MENLHSPARGIQFLFEIESVRIIRNKTLLIIIQVILAINSVYIIIYKEYFM